jgi:hypothetical protein
VRENEASFKLFRNILCVKMEISELNNYSAETLYALLLVSSFLNFHFFYLIILFFATTTIAGGNRNQKNLGALKEKYKVTW